MIRLKTTVNEVLARHTDKTLREIESDTMRDYYFSSEEARSYGLVDAVMVSRDIPRNKD